MRGFKIYSKEDCIWCDKAKKLLVANGYDYVELLYGEDYTKDDLRALVGPDAKLTTPQIVHDYVLIGGYEKLVEMLSNKKDA